ncbi:glycosyltransferase [Glycomyces tenuis]|uniref:glycosyltransferase n=3 Tax=Glycomyces tenuis TaxID=58116 RepID=UPI0005504834|nr:glycosyltransferase [Glycomyces tenuis]
MPTTAKLRSGSGRAWLRFWQAAAVLTAAAWSVLAPYGRWIAVACLAVLVLALAAEPLLRRPRVRPEAEPASREAAEAESAPEPVADVPAAGRTPTPVLTPAWEEHTGNRKVLHVIATRHGIGVFDEHWFAYRQHLLENITVPSLDAQTRQDFVWLVGIDRDMPPIARERLDELAATRPYVRLLELELKNDFRDAVAKWAVKRAPRREADWVLTTRLDDDDAFDTGLVERLRAEAGSFLSRGERRPALFAPVLGCNWVPSRTAGHRTFRPGPSIGLSLLLPAGDRRSVYHWNHMRVNKELAAAGAYVKCFDDDTLWWLYANTTLSDQQGAQTDRRARAVEHPNVFDLDEDLLGRFGISAESAERLRSVPEPDPVDTTYYLTNRGLDVEREIAALRRSLSREDHDETEAEAIKARMAELHAERRRMHEHIVKPPVDAPARHHSPDSGGRLPTAGTLEWLTARPPGKLASLQRLDAWILWSTIGSATSGSGAPAMPGGTSGGRRRREVECHLPLKSTIRTHFLDVPERDVRRAHCDRLRPSPGRGGRRHGGERSHRRLPHRAADPLGPRRTGRGPPRLPRARRRGAAR